MRKKIMSLYQTLILTLACLLFPSSLNAKTFKEGYSFYTKGDFSNAEKSFASALNTRLANSEKAQVFKFLGISQYMLGKKGPAQQSFTRAIAASPSITIDPNEVLDESVVSVFNNLKKAKEPPKPKPSPPKQAVPAPVRQREVPKPLPSLW